MRRTLDPSAFNRIANHPQVRPWLGGTDPLDLSGIVGDPENFAFLTESEEGGYIYHKQGAGLYMVHTLSEPGGRGRAMLEARAESLRAMFTQSDCIEVITILPDGNAAADKWAAHAGFRELYRRELSFDLMGERVGASYRSLGYGEWVTRDKEAYRRGVNLHHLLHQFVTDDHGDDALHHAWAGATWMGCEAGNPGKAVGLYNRFAAHCGYRPIRVLTVNPLVLDIGSAVVQCRASGLELLLVRAARSALPIEETGEFSCLSESGSPRASAL